MHDNLQNGLDKQPYFSPYAHQQDHLLLRALPFRSTPKSTTRSFRKKKKAQLGLFAKKKSTTRNRLDRHDWIQCTPIGKRLLQQIGHANLIATRSRRWGQT
jgi:hypothetical protein